MGRPISRPASASSPRCGSPIPTEGSFIDVAAIKPRQDAPVVRMLVILVLGCISVLLSGGVIQGTVRHLGSGATVSVCSADPAAVGCRWYPIGKGALRAMPPRSRPIITLIAHVFAVSIFCDSGATAHWATKPGLLVTTA